MKPAQRIAILSSIIAAIFVGPFSRSIDAAESSAAPAGTVEAKRIFSQRCTACHTYGKGTKVGPDLRGVTSRRERSWLVKFIRSSQTLIKAGDPVAEGLYSQFKQQRMPDWWDLNDPQIAALLDWFATNGPEQKEPDEYEASLATPKDLGLGRDLFTGRIPLANGGLACINCHALRAGPGVATIPIGGTLGPNLTATYLRYRDRAMTLFLRHPCFPRVPQGSEYLQPGESFALKALMRQSSLSLQRSTAAAIAPASSTSVAMQKGTP